MKTFKLVVVGIIFLFIYPMGSLHGQIKDWWHYGSLYLVNGDTKEGYMQYDTDLNYLLIKQNRAIMAYNPQQVASYEIYDLEQKQHRLFYSLPYQDKNRKTHQFFELIKEGELILLSRETWIAHMRPADPLAGNFNQVPFDTELVKGDQFYILQNNNKLIRFWGNKKELLALMEDRAGEVENFIHNQKLDLNRRNDLVRVLHFYEELKQE